MNFPAPSFKNSYISGGNLQSLKNKNLHFRMTAYFICWKNFSNISAKIKKVSYTCPYKEAKFSKL